ncbi:DASH complex subunit Dad1-domain-containing protein [Cladorrhinum sp. PSN332]|nr:DASH complex subunit Dad1-domain-containing protein [Cladorrhinum sp. PSN332]
MASYSRSTSAAGQREKTYFELQREQLMSEIATSFEHVLANINKLNRSLEAVIAVGNEFSSVEALWSTFENVMAKDEGEGQDLQQEGEDGHVEQEQEYEEEDHHEEGEEGYDEDEEMEDLTEIQIQEERTQLEQQQQQQQSSATGSRYSGRERLYQRG